MSGAKAVLILVLMEYALEEAYITLMKDLDRSLNPCFNGICSRRAEWEEFKKEKAVLILVLMEYALEG